ncbi:MAG TPA: hypothetical protein VNI78_03875 [Vicinamibacterales bacterium]|nr:hypothetical protein [Vicinamibacterales bacterium]
MSGRRSHARFAVNPVSDGVLRVRRDVLVEHAGERELVVLSREPGIVSEPLAIEIPDLFRNRVLGVRVAESRLVVEGGTVRHRLRLEVTDRAATAPLTAVTAEECAGRDAQ